MKNIKLLFGFIFLIIIAGCNQSGKQSISLPKIFSDHMVLQRDADIPVWGKAGPGRSVSVKLAGNSVTVKADTAGNWMAKLPAMKAGGPYEMEISGGNKITFMDVMVGDVWFASGQSNMEFAVQSANNAAAEIKDAINHPEVRLFTVPRVLSSRPANDLPNGNWVICDSTTVKEFSAVAYFFGRQLNKEKNIPVGLINDSWGGTPVEAWTSLDKMKTIPVFNKRMAESENNNLTDADIELDRKNDSARWAIASSSFVGLTEHVQNSDYDDSKWAGMNVPGSVDHSAIGPHNGIIWFRKSFEIRSVQPGTELILKLGKIDLKDDTWFNGEKIGESVYNEGAYRSYRIPAGLAKPGRNVICIRVIDIWSVGGLIGPSDSLAVMDARTGKVLAKLAGTWKYNEKIEPVFPEVKGYSGYPSLIFNGMVSPVIPFAIKGAIWYQGEANAGRAYQYRTLFPLMINDWRERWHEGDFPFLFVQLPNFMVSPSQPAESDWAELREAQAMTLALKNTGMAVTIELGDVTNIHPTDKQDVAKRLVLAADKIAYGQNIVYSGPMYKSMTVSGNSVVIKFDNTGSGLISTGNKPLKGFAIAGKDKKFFWADAKISGDEVTVSSPRVKMPVAVRYGWASSPDCNLYNKEGLPASPFRTDDWPGITVNNE